MEVFLGPRHGCGGQEGACSSQPSSAPASRLCWAAHPQHWARGGGASTWGLRSPLCFFQQRPHDVDSDCVQGCVQSPRRRTTLQVWMLSGPWAWSRAQKSGVPLGGRRALSPLAGAPGSAALSQLGLQSTHSSTVVAQSRGACPGHPAFLVREEATASWPGLCRGGSG